MGLGLFGNSDCRCCITETMESLAVKNANPNPMNFKVVKAYFNTKALAMLVWYPNCTNYEGRKILVFETQQALDIVNSQKLDPHFCDCRKIGTLIARFVPTVQGWDFATRFVNELAT